ncbi:MAG TPA: LytTR family DNA-binding domain-containing protein, partial [Gemmatimonadaceae bacterium]|nr:LytTR family DNA-binding domain-containing protein [Gemmatimonadaceae bacterium]
MIRTLIADDEALSRRLVHQLLERHNDVEIVAECADGEAAREAIAEHHPDVVFLDIRMPVQSGLDVARSREPRGGPLIVFVTAYDQFAVPAFETDAVDYLTKPLSEERFDATLDRVRERLRLRRQDERRYVPHLITRVGSRDVIVPLSTVDYIEADDVYAAVIARGRRHLVRTPLDVLERTLDPAMFARIHRSYIVRLDRVAEVRRDRASGP